MCVSCLEQNNLFLIINNIIILIFWIIFLLFSSIFTWNNLGGKGGSNRIKKIEFFFKWIEVICKGIKPSDRHHHQQIWFPPWGVVMMKWRIFTYLWLRMKINLINKKTQVSYFSSYLITLNLDFLGF